MNSQPDSLLHLQPQDSCKMAAFWQLKAKAVVNVCRAHTWIVQRIKAFALQMPLLQRITRHNGVLACT